MSKVAVVGAGTMGNSIAQVVALMDKALELGYGHPMGPLKVSDLVGLDVRLAITDYAYQQLKQPHYEPPRLLRGKVAAGELGKKTGKGFYEWTLKK